MEFNNIITIKMSGFTLIPVIFHSGDTNEKTITIQTKFCHKKKKTQAIKNMRNTSLMSHLHNQWFQSSFD